MKTLLIGSMLIFSSCSMLAPRQTPEQLTGRKPIQTRADRIMSCVDKYIGEGFQKAYKICDDLYTKAQ